MSEPLDEPLVVAALDEGRYDVPRLLEAVEAMQVQKLLLQPGPLRASVAMLPDRRPGRSSGLIQRRVILIQRRAMVSRLPASRPLPCLTRDPTAPVAQPICL
jgi:hypothetical protein